RREVLRLLGAGVAITVGCAPAAPATPAQPAATSVSTVAPAPAATAVAQPKRGGTLRVGMVNDAARLDGQLVTTVNATWMPFDRLTAYDGNLKPQPMLAES